MIKKKFNINISLIVALKQGDKGIGCDNQLLWHLPRDLKFFKDTTTSHYIIMGRRTFESINKPLPNRVNIVVTSQENYKEKHNLHYPNLEVKDSLTKAIRFVEKKGVSNVFIVGGAEIFRQAIKFADNMFITEVIVDDPKIKADTFFPPYPPEKWKIVSQQEFEPDSKNKYHIIIKEFANIENQGGRRKRKQLALQF